MQDATSSIFEFAGVGELAETTTQLLSLNLQNSLQSNSPSNEKRMHNIDQIAQLVLQKSKDYLGEVREGFMLSLRTSQISAPGQLRYLLDRVLLDWDQFSQELGLEDFVSDSAEIQETPDFDHQIKRIREQLLAFGMAVIALGQLPKLPAEQVTFPHSYSDSPTYADIPVPNTPGEMLWRIDELEKTVWKMMGNDLQELVQQRYGSVRRTYGFFEASAWLANRESERFGMKKQRGQLTFF